MALNTILVSVVIPTFNRAKWIVDAVESAFEQTYPHIELIVVDDGSIDNTADLLESYGDKILILRTENHGVSAARNTGIRVARGDLISFLDSDDYWLPEKIERQVGYFRIHPNMQICQTGEIWIRHGRRVNPRRKHAKQDGWIFERSLELCIVTPSAVMMRRNLFDEVGLFDEEMPVCEDYDLWLRISSRFSIGLIDEPLAIKRGGHDDQLSRQGGLDKWRIYAMEKLMKSGALTADQQEAARKEYGIKCRIYADGCAKRGKTREAAIYRAKIEKAAQSANPKIHKSV